MAWLLLKQKQSKKVNTLMNDNQEHDEQARKLDQFHDKYHHQKRPDWIREEAHAEEIAETYTHNVEQHPLEIDGQKQEDIQKHLEGVINRLEQVMNSPIEVTTKRIDADAATIAVLAVISELLPEQIQKQIRNIIALHEKTWKIDMPAVEGEIPRKPLSEVLMDTIAQEDESSEA